MSFLPRTTSGAFSRFWYALFLFSFVFGFYFSLLIASLTYQLFSSMLFIFKISCLFFWAAPDLCCCAPAFSSCGQQGLFSNCSALASVVVASLVGQHGLQGVQASVVVQGLSSCSLQAVERGLSSCGTCAQLSGGICSLPRRGIEPMSPVLQGGFLTTAPPGKPQHAV